MNYNRDIPKFGAPKNAMSIFNYHYTTSLRGMPVFAPEGGSEGGSESESNDEEAVRLAAEAAEVARVEAEKAKKPSDESAKLLKEVMKLKADKQKLADNLKAFEGIDLEKVNKLVAEADTAEKARQAAEDDRLKAAGDWEKLKERIVAEGKAENQRILDELKTEREKASKLAGTINELTVGSAFAASSFIKEDTILTPPKARKFYEDHFDVEEGKVVPYDAPRGSSSRTQLVNGSGESLAFDEAMKRIIDADPDRDSLLRSKRVPGSGQGGRDVDGGNRQQEKKVEGGISRIAAGLANGGLKTIKSGLPGK